MLFGLTHQEWWFAATIAGLVYAVTALRTGRLLDAIIAHVTTNVLLLFYVGGTMRWELWG